MRSFGGRETSVREVLGQALRRLPTLIGAGLLTLIVLVGIVLAGVVFSAVLFVGGGVAVFLGLIVFVGALAAMFFVSVRWTIYQQAIMLERAGAAEALSRSWRLVSGSGWRVFGYVILVGLAVGLLGLVTGTVPSVLGLDSTTATDVALSTALQLATSVLVAPFVPIVLTLLYYDLRFRKGEHVPEPGQGLPTDQKPLPTEQ